MNAVVLLQIALASVLAIAVAWRAYQQRADFPSKNRYAAWIAGLCLMLAAAALIEAHLRLGYSNNFAIAGAAVICVALGLTFWGQRGRKPKSKQS